MQAQQHRSRRLLLFADEAVLVGQRQVNAGRLDTGKRLDRTGQFAFQATLEIQPFLELRDAEAAVVQQLEAGHRALGQALGGQAQAGVMHTLGGHQDGVAAFGILVGDVQGGQLRHHGAAVLV